MSVDLEKRDRVAVLTLNRPDVLNAVSAEVLDAIDARLDAIQADDSLRAVVITGAGEKAFTAGADLEYMREATPIEARDFAGRGHAVCRRLETFALPVVAAVNGYALGGGCEIALACDMRLAAESARFALPEVKLGMLPGWGGTQRLPRLTSPAFAKGMIFTGRMVKADEAAAAGLADAIHPDADLLDAAVELAAGVAEMPPLSIRMSKALINGAMEGDLAGGLERERESFALTFTTEDRVEGFTAFFDKRDPAFTGR